MLSTLISVKSSERPDFLRSALKALADQSVPADETILVEDGPLADELRAIISSFSSSLNIRSVPLAKSHGLGYALNVGLAQCSGDLVARADSDDISVADRFEVQLDAFARDEQLDILSGFAIEIDEFGVEGDLRGLPLDHQDIIGSLWANPIMHSATMFKRDRISSIGSYRKDLRRRQDYELWFRCAEHHFRFANLGRPLVKYRVVGDAASRQNPREAFRQGTIGFKGSTRMGYPLWIRLACFAPFVRSLLPGPAQKLVRKWMNRMDPRNRHARAPKNSSATKNSRPEMD